MTRSIAAIAASIALIGSVSACRGTAGQALPPGAGTAPDQPSVVMTGLRPGIAPWAGKIKHVIIIYQENRTPDNLFNGLPGADTVTYGYNHLGQKVNLVQVSTKAPYDLSHRHNAFVREYNNGKMNGFGLEATAGCGNPSACPPPAMRAYGIVPRSEVQPYFDMAAEWGFGDRMFQANQGPSFPSHQYLISGTSTLRTGSSLRAAENPLTPQQNITGGCNAPAGSLVMTIDPAGKEIQKAYPCFERLTLMDLVDAKNLKWHYYQFKYAPSLWSGPDAIKHISIEKNYHAEVLAPSSRVLSDILNGDLESVVWVTPNQEDSDHAQVTDGGGPAWVAGIVNAVGESPYWKDTVILVTWDDWGGWYDHVKPPMYNSYELGFRVPLLVISPYAKKAYVSHHQHEIGSLLKFTEETFSLGSLGTTDVRADDLADFFDFTQAPRKFVPIKAPIGPMYFLNQKTNGGSPDDDF